MAIALPARPRYRLVLLSGLVLLGGLAFSALFVYINLVNYRWLSPLYERSTSPTVWGLIQRLYLIIPMVVLSLWLPRQMGFQTGKIGAYWKMLAIMLVANVGVISLYLALTGSTPYSGFGMIVNEAVTVPLVEEIVWRGALYAALLAILKRILPEDRAALLAGIYSGVCFGLVHANNALFGYPLVFVLIQTLNATVWGVVYGIARAKTGSLYPSIIMHAAMNLAVALV